MPDTTPVYAFPYPQATDPPNGPAQIQALAEAVETEIARGDTTPFVEARLTNGQWTKPAGLKAVRVICVGGGGGGGGASGTLTDEVSGGTGGNAGVVSESIIPAGDLAETETITIGSGGSGGFGINPSSGGGPSSFGTHVVANGGHSGRAEDNAAPPRFSPPSSPTGTGAATGQLRTPGMAGSQAVLLGASHSFRVTGGIGGSGRYGAGGHGNGGNGDGRGAGGGGVANQGNVSARTGGDGSGGVVVIEHFF